MWYKIGQGFLLNGIECDLVYQGGGFRLLNHRDGNWINKPMQFETKYIVPSSNVSTPDILVNIPDDSDLWIDEATGQSNGRDDFQIL